MEGEFVAELRNEEKSLKKLKSRVLKYLKECNTVLTWNKIGESLIKTKETSRDVYRFWRVLCGSNIRSSSSYWPVPEDLSSNEDARLEVVRQIKRSTAFISWEKVRKSIYKLGEESVTVIPFLKMLIIENGLESPTGGSDEGLNAQNEYNLILSKLIEEKIRNSDVSAKSKKNEIAGSVTRAIPKNGNDMPENAIVEQDTESSSSDSSKNTSLSSPEETDCTESTSSDSPSLHGNPMILAFIFEVSSRMQSLWSAVQESVNMEIAAARLQTHNELLICAHTVSNRYKILHSYKKESFDLPIDLITESDECSIIDAIMWKLNELHFFTAKHTRYRNNVVVLVYTKGNDSGSKHDLCHLARAVAAVRKRGWKVQFMCAASRTMAEQVGAKTTPEEDAVEWGGARVILERLEAGVSGNESEFVLYK